MDEPVPRDAHGLGRGSVFSVRDAAVFSTHRKRDSIEEKWVSYLHFQLIIVQMDYFRIVPVLRCTLVLAHRDRSVVKH